MLKAVSSVTNAIGALNYKGTWNASTNSPALASGVGAKGDYYVVSTAGSTTLDGISNWGIGDWAVFNGSVWQRVEGGADLNGVNLSVSGISTLQGKTTVGTSTQAANADLSVGNGISVAASGLYKPYREFSKALELTDNTLTTYLTITIPAVANFNDFVNVGGEISYAILVGRETSSRDVGTVYGKLYVSIARFFESAANAPVTVSIVNTDQALASTGGITPTITWSTSQTAGIDNAAKDVYIEITVDNPASGSVVQAIAGSFKYHSMNRYVDDIAIV